MPIYNTRKTKPEPCMSTDDSFSPIGSHETMETWDHPGIMEGHRKSSGAKHLSGIVFVNPFNIKSSFLTNIQRLAL